VIDLDEICECGHPFSKHTPMGDPPGECMECWWTHKEGRIAGTYKRCQLRVDAHGIDYISPTERQQIA
jgi:hypothetical protein